MHLRRHRASTTTDSHVPLATNKRSDHEPLGRPVGARPRHTEVPVIGMTFLLFIAALVFVRTKYLPKKYDARTLELIDPLIDLAPIDKTPSTADLLEEGTPPSSPAPQVVSLSPVRNRAGSA